MTDIDQKPTTLTFEVRNKAAYITFNTPDRLNSITEARLAEMARVLDALEADPRLTSVVLRGEGRAFCVGLDLDLLKEAFAKPDYFADVVDRLALVLQRLEALPVPVIAAVNGYARAGGFEIALACDLMIIAAEAKIGDNHAHVNVMPGGGSTARLPRRIGAQRAKELIWTAKWLTGPEAVDYGLALKSVPLAELDREVEALVDVFRQRAPACLAVIKRTIAAGADLPLAEAVALELEAFKRYMRDEPYARQGFEAAFAS